MKPSVRATSKRSSSRKGSMNAGKEATMVQEPEVIPVPQMNQDLRGKKLPPKQSRSIPKRQQVNFPVKVQNLDTLVQIKKKRPKMKFQDKLAFDAQRELEAYN